MLAIKTVLHPTDFSESSGFAFRLACAVARDHGARLVVLHVTARPAAIYGDGIYPPWPDEGHDDLRAQLEQLQPRCLKVAVEHRLVEGEPAPVSLRVAEETHCDVIIMGTHGRTGLGRLLMGSVAEQVVRRAPCPVVTAKAPLPRARRFGEAPAETADSPALSTRE
jgi:nucleotide-binding universal stress UspA family protein